MHGIPKTIRVWRWHLQSMPQCQKYLSRGQLTRLEGLHLISKGLEMAINKGLAPHNSTHRLLHLLNKQQHVNLPPAKLFSHTSGSLTASLDKVFFIASHEAIGISIQPVAPEEIAERMVFSLQEEQQRFLSYYRKFRFAFPGAQNSLVEETASRQREELLRLLSKKEAYTVYHPYPLSLPTLFKAMSPYLIGK
jgi:hypothetical protein